MLRYYTTKKSRRMLLMSCSRREKVVDRDVWENGGEAGRPPDKRRFAELFYTVIDRVLNAFS